MRNMISDGRLPFTVAVSLTLWLGGSALGEIVGIKDGGGIMYRIDELTGHGTYLGKIGEVIHYGGFRSLALGPDRLLYTIGNRTRDYFDWRLYAIDPQDGSFTRGALLSGGYPDSLAFAPNGTVYAASDSPYPHNTFYTLDVATGQASEIGRLDQHTIHSLDFSPSGELYALSGAGLVTMDPATASITRIIASRDTLPPMWSITFAPDGTLYGAASDLYAIDSATGAWRLVGLGNWGEGGHNSMVSAIAFVPEPSTLASLAVLGAVGLLIGWRRRARGR